MQQQETLFHRYLSSAICDYKIWISILNGQKYVQKNCYLIKMYTKYKCIPFHQHLILKSATKWKILQSIPNSNKLKWVNSLNRCTVDRSRLWTLKTTLNHQSFQCSFWPNSTGSQSRNQSSTKFSPPLIIALLLSLYVPKINRKLVSNTIQRAESFCTAKTFKITNIRIKHSFIVKCWETTKYYMHHFIMNSIHK